MNSKLNTFLLVACFLLLIAIAVGVWTRPSLDDIDKRIQFWSLHYAGFGR